jgi:hypothetical protein
MNFMATVQLIIAYCIRTSLSRIERVDPDSAKSA